MKYIKQAFDEQRVLTIAFVVTLVISLVSLPVLFFLVMATSPEQSRTIQDVNICSYKKYRDVNLGVCWVTFWPTSFIIPCEALEACKYGK